MDLARSSRPTARDAESSVARLVGRALLLELRRLRAALSEEVILELSHPDALTRLADQVEPVLVDEHLRMLQPLLPSRLGNLIKDLLTQLTANGRPVEALKLLAEFYALNGSCHANYPVLSHETRVPGASE